MSASQRNKGAAGERELCKLLSDELGVTVRRNVDQARAGGADCLELEGFAIECKRHENLRRPSWWAQAVAQAEKCGAEPSHFTSAKDRMGAKNRVLALLEWDRWTRSHRDTA